MNPGEKPPANSAPLSEEEITKRRKAALAASFTETTTEPEPIPSTGLEDSDDDIGQSDPSRDDAAVAIKREGIRQAIFHGENIGRTETEESTIKNDSNIRPDGRVVRRKK